MKTKLLTALIICFCILSGCKKSHDGCGCPPDGDQLVVLPRCISAKIDEIKNEPKHNPPSQVYQYRYNGQVVYFFTSYCCDIPSIVCDENCNAICSPDGGLTGNGDGQCTDFYKNAKCDILVWKDER